MSTLHRWLNVCSRGNDSTAMRCRLLLVATNRNLVLVGFTSSLWDDVQYETLLIQLTTTALMTMMMQLDDDDVA